MSKTDKWQVSPIRTGTSSNPDDAAEGSHEVNSIEKALQAIAPRRGGRFSCKRFHMIFDVVRPQGS